MAASQITHPIPAQVLSRARVTKRLNPGDNGTKRWLAQYGDSIVCVRYRQDGKKRYTTVELVVDEQTLLNPPRKEREIIAVAIDCKEQTLRLQARQSGATWDGERRLCLMPRATAKRLGLEDRIQSV